MTQFDRQRASMRSSSSPEADATLHVEQAEGSESERHWATESPSDAPQPRDKSMRGLPVCSFVSHCVACLPAFLALFDLSVVQQGGWLCCY